MTWNAYVGDHECRQCGEVLDWANQNRLAIEVSCSALVVIANVMSMRRNPCFAGALYFHELEAIVMGILTLFWYGFCVPL